MIYTNRQSFFTKIEGANSRVRTIDKTPIGTDKDKYEISRGDTYAVLDDMRDPNIPITIATFRESLIKQGVTDAAFQDKILFLLLQHRGGIQFQLGKTISDMLMEEKGIPLSVGDNILTLKVNGPVDVTLTINTTLNEKDLWDSEKVTPTLETSVKVNITPDMVLINDFEVTQIAETKTAAKAFNFFEDSQQNILEKFISFIRHALGFNSELRLEDKENNAPTGMNQV
jgi:hypothetical protein